MIERTCSSFRSTLLLLSLLPAVAIAQQAVTVTGHVSAGNMPVRGATVRIEDLSIEASTNVDGRYSFIIPSTRVRGQTVKLSVKYLRYRPQSVAVRLTGESILQDFELTTDAPAQPVTPVTRGTTPDTPRQQTGAPPTGSIPVSAPVLRSATGSRIRTIAANGITVVDSSQLTEAAGVIGLGAALSGRVPGLDIQTAGAIGGTSSMVLRGEHSIAGLTQPLLVIDGIIADNSNITSILQRQGQGGFDYGSTINDISVEDIAAVEVLAGPAAAIKFGGRGANGAVLVYTKRARGLNGFEVSATQQVSSSSVLRLPEFQNSYGQGLNGLFTFFNGKGGGVNDGVSQSWGPALNGQPVVQASLFEAQRGDVRAFSPIPDNVSGYFASGRNVLTNFALQGGNATGHFRAALSNRLYNGLTPDAAVTQRSAIFAGNATPNSKLDLTGDVQLISNRGESRPGTGLDESNTVAGFYTLPRQVDVAVYSARRRDATGAQLSWNYNGRNNPYFSTKENDNHDNRSRVLGGASASLALSDWVTAIAQGGADHSTEHRSFLVANGWMGGYPYYLGRGDFTTGGFQNEDITRTASNVDLTIRASPASTGAARFGLSGGVGYRGDQLSTTVRGADKLTDTLSQAPVLWNSDVSTLSVFGGVDGQINAFNFTAALRQESVSPTGGSSASTIYPAVLASIDLARLDSTRKAGSGIESFVIHGGWSRAGNAATTGLFQRLGFSAATTAAQIAQVSTPEVTTDFQIGAALQAWRGALSLDATFYSDRSENLIIPDGVLNRTGVISNKGITGSATIVPVRMPGGLTWSVTANAGHNTNLVESLSGGATSIDLAPPVNGVSLAARTGSSLGTIMGTRYLRDAGGALLLRNGQPLPDSLSGPVALGSTQPTFSAGISSTVRSGIFEASILFDARQGGKLYSSSNRNGGFAGTLLETANRPDGGTVIAGTDVSTSSANTTPVTTENYYHALGGIAERWVYDASYVKLRDVRVTLTVPLQLIEALSAQSLRVSLIGRNLALWANVPNVDPEMVLSTSTYRGLELGQLPTTKTIGVQVSLTP